MDETTTQPPATAAPQPSEGAPPIQNIDDVYGEFDTIEQPKQPAAPKKEAAQPKAPPTESKGVEPPATSVKSKDAGESSGKETSTVPDATAKGEPPKPVKAAELRSAYENLKREHKTLKAEFEQVKTKSNITDELKQLRELLDAERKARSQMEEELKFTAYEKSQEFKDKFQKPYYEAYKMGRQKAASLKISQKLDDLGEVVRPGRQGTEADFDEIMRLDDDDTAAEKAVDLFGNKAQMVLYYRERVQELHNSSRNAIEDYRNNASTRDKELTEARNRQQQEQAEKSKVSAENFKKYVEQGKEARSELFTPAEGDTEAKEIIKRGEAVADSLFSGIHPKTGKPYTPDGLVKFHAFVRNAVAAHGHLLHKLAAMNTHLAELESDLAEYKKSGSSEDSGRGGEKPSGTELPGDAEFDALEAKSTRRW